jgi:hypothetical protein
MFSAVSSLHALQAAESRAHRWVLGYVCHEMRNPLHVIKACVAPLRALHDNAGGTAAAPSTCGGRPPRPDRAAAASASGAYQLL